MAVPLCHAEAGCCGSLVLNGKGHEKRKPRPQTRSGFFTLRLVGSTLADSLRYAPAMMLMTHSGTGARSKNRAFPCAATQIYIILHFVARLRQSA